MGNKIIFKENLNLFRRNSLLIWIGFGLLFAFLVYSQITSRNDYNDHTKNWILGIIIVVVSLFFSFISLLAYFMVRLKTEISEEQIRIKYLRIIEKTINWEQVVSADIVTCKIVGNKLATGWENYGAVKNNKGSNAIAIVLKNGKKILIGTEKVAELNKLIEKMPVANISYNSLWFYSTPK
nr:hypothetical protein [uncultured Psychroserpens sp.]